MAMSEDMYKKKMLEIDHNTNKVLADIRDLLLASNILRLAQMADNPNVSETNYKCAKNALNDVKESIDRRWAE